MTRSLRSLSLTLATLAFVLAPSLAFAQDHAAAGDKGWFALGAGLAAGFAALGCGVGQGIAASAALSGIARNPTAASKIQTPMILGLALIESLMLLGWLIAFFLQSKI
jgi:F-type H+-transporting ATPase subunit c